MIYKIEWHALASFDLDKISFHGAIAILSQIFNKPQCGLWMHDTQAAFLMYVMKGIPTVVMVSVWSRYFIVLKVLSFLAFVLDTKSWVFKIFLLFVGSSNANIFLKCFLVYYVISIKTGVLSF